MQKPSLEKYRFIILFGLLCFETEPQSIALTLLELSIETN